jgi:hypothetical protein
MTDPCAVLHVEDSEMNSAQGTNGSPNGTLKSRSVVDIIAKNNNEVKITFLLS